jgi:hypothetical protein
MQRSNDIKTKNMKKQVRLSGTQNTNYNQFAQLVGETNKFYVISLQEKETLYRHNRCFSKKTLKCVSNGSEFTKRCKIIEFR